MNETKKELEKLIEKEFKEQRDPYGRKWKKVEGEPFDREHHLENSISVVKGDGCTILTDNENLHWHQSGTEHLPQRMMVPDKKRGLGRWKKPISQMIDKQTSIFLILNVKGSN